MRKEVEGYISKDTTTGFRFLGRPKLPEVTWQVARKGRVNQLRNFREIPDICISFRSINDAFAVLTAQRSTPQVYAENRMVVEGNIVQVMTSVRCLNRV